jgi:hypothetical protein
MCGWTTRDVLKPLADAGLGQTAWPLPLLRVPRSLLDDSVPVSRHDELGQLGELPPSDAMVKVQTMSNRSFGQSDGGLGAKPVMLVDPTEPLPRLTTSRSAAGARARRRLYGITGSELGAGAAPSVAWWCVLAGGGSTTPCPGCSRTSISMCPWIRSISVISW